MRPHARYAGTVDRGSASTAAGIGLRPDGRQEGSKSVTEGSSSRRSDTLRSVGWAMAAACVAIALLRLLHVSGAIDGAFRSLYYGLSSASESTQRVVLVEADDDTDRKSVV